MTSRRSMQTYGERVSRALQFVPGHVGGRVASAQPIRRRGGNLRSASVGAVAASPFPLVLRPDAITYYDAAHQPTYQGGGAQTTLRDDSDATYMQMQVNRTGGGVKTYWPCVATFEACAPLPAGATITSATISLRARKDSAVNVWMTYDVAKDITPGGTWTPYYLMSEPFNPLTTSFADHTGAGIWSALPSVAVLEAGQVQMYMQPGINIVTGDYFVDVSEVTLTIDGTV